MSRRWSRYRANIWQARLVSIAHVHKFNSKKCPYIIEVSSCLGNFLVKIHNRTSWTSCLTALKFRTTCSNSGFGDLLAIPSSVIMLRKINKSSWKKIEKTWQQDVPVVLSLTILKQLHFQKLLQVEPHQLSVAPNSGVNHSREGMEGIENCEILFSIF